MNKLFLSGFVCLASMNLIIAKDINYFEITGTPGHTERYRDPHQRYVDIFTNYPNTDAVLKSYNSFKQSGQKYMYPKSSIQPTGYFPETSSYNTQSNVHNRRKSYYNMPSNNEDFVKFDADFISKFDSLQSDYGDFENYHDIDFSDSNNRSVTTGGDDHYFVRARPKFKTKRNFTTPNEGDLFDKVYFSNIQKIPSYEALNHSEEVNENVNLRIRELLKKYLAKLYKKRLQNAVRDDDKEEVLDVSPEITDNIETLSLGPEGEEEHIPENEHFYEIINEASQNTLNLTKSKFLDPSKLIILKNSTKLLANKFLSLFTIIQFPNTPCVGTDTVNYYDGICYYLTECQSMNGTAMGSCANGYGVCCVFTGSCGDSGSQNCTYFQSPNYPNYYPSNGTVVPPPPTNGTIDPRLRYQLMVYLARQASTTNSLSCVYQVIKSSSSIRQLRIDFLDLELRGPTNGTCVDERLIITGQNTNDVIPVICGYNTGQHVYVDVTDVDGPISLSILSSAVERKRFSIRICQINSCTTPQNCLQYYTGARGIISSFNYDQATSLSRSVPGYFNNLNYAVCIRREAGYCSITYTTIANGTTYPFNIRNVDDAGQSTVPPGQAGAEIFSCPDDYIVINGIRLCGERLNDGSVTQNFMQNAPVTDTSAGPIILPVRTDARVTARGFRLFYTQNRCPNT